MESTSINSVQVRNHYLMMAHTCQSSHGARKALRIPRETKHKPCSGGIYSPGEGWLHWENCFGLDEHHLLQPCGSLCVCPSAWSLFMSLVLSSLFSGCSVCISQVPALQASSVFIPPTTSSPVPVPASTAPLGTHYLRVSVMSERPHRFQISHGLLGCPTWKGVRGEIYSIGLRQRA